MFMLVCNGIRLGIVVPVLHVVIQDFQLVGSELLRLTAPWTDPISHIHDDLLEHEDRKE